MKHLCFILLCLLFIGCKVTRKASTVEETKEQTTEVERYVLKDTTVFIPGDTVRLETAVPCPDVSWHTEAKGSKSKIKASVTKGKLIVECFTDSLTHRIQLLEKQLERTYKTETAKTITAPIQYQTPKWVWWIIIIETGLLAIVFRKEILSVAKHFVNA